MYHLIYIVNGAQHVFNSSTPFPSFAIGQHVQIGAQAWSVNGIVQRIDETPTGLEFGTGVYLGPIAALHGGGGTNPVPWPWLKA